MTIPKQTGSLPISSLQPDAEGSGLFDAPEMEIYDQIIKAEMQKLDLRPILRELAGRPAEDRYIFRIVAALGFAFGDFDSSCIRFDLETLPAADLQRIRKLLDVRAMQFFLFCQMVFGEQHLKDLLSRITAGDEIETAEQQKTPARYDRDAVYFKRDGSPCTYEKWSELLADQEYSRLQSTKLGDGTVIETSWLGLDGRSLYLRRPKIPKHLIFVTVVQFAKQGKKKRASKYFHYATEREAKDGHAAAVRKYGASGKAKVA